MQNAKTKHMKECLLIQFMLSYSKKAILGYEDSFLEELYFD